MSTASATSKKAAEKDAAAIAYDPTRVRIEALQLQEQEEKKEEKQRKGKGKKNYTVLRDSSSSTTTTSSTNSSPSKSSKNRLQELVDQSFDPALFTITYTHSESGPPHGRSFFCHCYSGQEQDMELLGTACASAKKEAEKKAAGLAYDNLQRKIQSAQEAVVQAHART